MDDPLVLRRPSPQARRVETEKAARRELRARQEANAQGLYIPGADRTTFENLATLLLDEYRANGRRSLDRADDAVSHLREFFDCYKARAITGDRVLAYMRQRQEAGAANATINRELAALKRMFRLGLKSGKVARCPSIDLLQEDNTRKASSRNRSSAPCWRICRMTCNPSTRSPTSPAGE